VALQWAMRMPTIVWKLHRDAGLGLLAKSWIVVRAHTTQPTWVFVKLGASSWHTWGGIAYTRAPPPLPPGADTT
jgi:hypothetical protein